jgi:outer membrane biosynthesis protein TonB
MSARAAFKLFRTAVLAAGLALPLSACETFDLMNLIPDTKKKLPGERREVFPEGVPGVSKGVPPELMKGYQAPPEEAAAAAPPEEKPKPEPKQAAKPKPKPKQAKPTPTVAPEYQGQAQQGQTQQGQWPSQQKPAQQSAWPQSPQPGTFSR